MKCLKLLFATILLPNLIFAQTFIYEGNVSGVWTASGNPYYILGNIALNELDNLQIEPGVEIIFTNNYMFNIFGHFTAIGSASDSIFFTVADTSGFQSGTHLGWGGLNFAYPATGEISYCIFEYSKASGISVWQFITIQNSTFRMNEGEGIHIFDGNIIADQIQILNNKGDGFSILQWSFQATQLENFIIKNNDGFGLRLGEQSAFEANDGIIEGNQNSGVIVGYETYPALSNIVVTGNGNPTSLGGGINVGGGCYLDHVTIISNEASFGGGIYCSPEGLEDLTVTNSIIENNIATVNGGGIYVSTGLISATGCQISNNSATKGGGVYFDLVDDFMSTTEFISCEISRNNATSEGGGMFCNMMISSPYFEHLTVVENTAGSGGGIINAEFDINPIYLSNSIFWNNSPDQIFDSFSKINLSFSNVEGGWTGAGNINDDPAFVDPLNGDYQLSWSNFPLNDNSKSPCIDAGDPLSLLDPDGTITDMGAYPFDQASAAVNLPLISAITDVPFDQGQKVVINWNKSLLDNSNGGIITEYSIWRAQNWADVPWEYIASTPAQNFDEYAMIAPTLNDSTGGNIPFYTFLVVAETNDPETYYRSLPDSGYSVDNIAPAVPMDITSQYAAGAIHFQWGSGVDPDIDHYAIYKANNPDNFTVYPQFLVYDTSFVDTEIIADTIYYRLSAIDIHENEGALSEIFHVITHGVILEAKVFLEGPYNGSSMSPDLNNSGFLPLEQPYNQPPWNYPGLESVLQIPNENVIDWILIEIRDAPAQYSASCDVLNTQAAFLLSNGQVVSLDGISPPRINIESNNDIYLSIKHRNHLGVLSSCPLVAVDGKYCFDFSCSSIQGFGGCLSQTEIATGTWGMFCGDANKDGQINNIDKNDFWAVNINQFGYLLSDFNMDGVVDANDKVNSWLPNTGHSCQIPE
jgi:hypothetical protein